VRVLGLMSGTSFDAIEVAAADLTLDGEDLVFRPLGSLSVPYDPGLAGDIAAVLPPAVTTAGRICALDTRIGQAFAEAAARRPGVRAGIAAARPCTGGTGARTGPRSRPPPRSARRT
jgi:anhydro-N-acetylmuramic acid kinase